MNNDIRSEVSKYNLPYNKLTIKSGVKIVDDRITLSPGLIFVISL